MKALMVFLCGVVAVSHAQFSSGQYDHSFGNFGNENPSSLQPFYYDSQFGTGHVSLASPSSPFDLFSTNTLNSNNVFRQQSGSALDRGGGFQTAPQNSFSTYSSYPFVNNQLSSPSSGLFSNQYSSPTNYNYQQPQSQSLSYPQVPQALQQNAYQTPASPLNEFSNQVQQSYPKTPATPAYHAPAPAPVNYQQPAYQPPVPQYNPSREPAYQAPTPVTTSRPVPYINTAQLSYNAAENALPSSNTANSSNTPKKPVVVHPPASVHYVSIGEKLEGDYKFGYETGKGSNGDESFRTETRDADGTVRGSYGYVDPRGKQITVHYEAGREGFKILSEDEVKGGAKRTPAAAPVQPNQPAPPAAVAPTTPPTPPTATETPLLEHSTQATPQRRRKRKPNQAQ
ncbi:probable ATP-dependent RNA helicase ddx17 isoform X2 [Varroa jacobsoni]|uniref:probable ATP-dependent RNA helicase ddx17 isoform X2 n=1 Tax=Varroa jacobsoni TaxID=62625 RepID=UPI000BF8AD23|nr:probable ATP-dependent RNA helicase ddx17 isoform X2 [Varroa jacobsoni]